MVKLKDLLSKLGKDDFYLMHLCYGVDKKSRKPLWNYARKNNQIGLAYEGIDDDWFKIPEHRRRKNLNRAWYRQFELFCEQMGEGDLVLVMCGESHLLGVGLVAGPYWYQDWKPTEDKEYEFFPHVRQVSWLINYEYEKRVPFKVRRFWQTLVRAPRGGAYWNRLMSRKLDITGTHKKVIKKIEKEREKRKRASIARKYPRGEGKKHRKLKEWVAGHPGFLGLRDVIKQSIEDRIEYEFSSGDRADVVFLRKLNKYAVVEVETDDPFPGAHQALKYKVLMCAKEGLDVKSPDVSAFLVARHVPPEVKKFCKKYGIRALVKRKLP